MFSVVKCADYVSMGLCVYTPIPCYGCMHDDICAAIPRILSGGEAAILAEW